MATQIGPKIGVDGEAEYRRQMSNIIQEAKTLKAEMNQLATEVTDEANAQENAARKAENLTQQIRNQEDRVRLLADQLQLCAEKYGEADTKTLQYREQLANAQTVLNELRQDQHTMTQETQDFADAEEEAGNNAITAGDLISANLISEAIIGGLKTLARLARGTAKAIAGIATDSAEYADEILSMSSVTGIATDELQAYAYMAELVDVDLDTITGSQTKLLQTMNSARNGTESAVSAFEALGIAVTDGDGNLRDVNTVFLEALDALGRIDNAAERDAAAMAIFGRSARDLNPMIEAGSDAIAAYAEEARQMGYIMSDSQLGDLGGLDDSFARFANLQTMIRNQLGSGMAPGIERVLDKLLEVGERIDWTQIGESLGRLISSLADVLVRLLESGAIDRLIGWLDEMIVRDQLMHPGRLTGGAAEDPAAAAAALTEAVAEYQALMARVNDPNAYMRVSEAGEEFLDMAALEADQARLRALMNDPAVQAALEGDAYALGEDIIASVAEGVESGAPQVAAALSRGFGLFSRPSTTYAGAGYDLGDALAATGGAAGVNYGGVSVQIYGADGMSAGELYDEFSYRLQNDVLAREAVYG